MKPIHIRVGGSGPYDPAVGDTDINIPIIAGQEAYIFKTGYGPEPYENYSSLSSGGFRFVTPLVGGEDFYIYLTGLAYGTDTGEYTNGFDRDQVISALFGRLGWKQPTIAGSPVLSSNNLLSKSGRYFNDGSFHSLVQIKTLKDTAELDGSADDATFNDYLDTLQRGVIMRCLNGVFSPEEYISQGLLYERFHNNDMPIVNGNLFCGIRIKTPATADLGVQIDSIALYFNKDVTFNLYLFNDLKKEPIWFSPVSAEANNQVVVSLPSIVLNHIGGNNHNGIFYLGYFQSDLGTAQALQEQDIWFASGMAYGYNFFQAPAKPGTDFDRRNVANNFTSSTYGLNPHISVFKDHTQQIVKKPALFDNLIGLQMAAQVIEQTIFSNRSNATERNAKENVNTANAFADLNGVLPLPDSPQTIGLKKQVTQELNRLKNAFFPEPEASSYSLCSS